MKELEKNLLKKQKTKHPFTTVYNSIFEDNKLTLRDVGLYIYMLSKPDDWHFSIRGIASQRIESKDTIAKMLNNLINNGWLSRKVIKKHGKYFKYVYEIFYIKQYTNPSHIQDTPSYLLDTEKRTVSNNYIKKEREDNFYNNNKSSILKYIDHLEKNSNVKNKEAHKRTIIKKFMTMDRSTIEVFEDWRLKINIDNLYKSFKNRLFDLECESIKDEYFLDKVKKNNSDIILIFQGSNKTKGIFQLRHTVKNIYEATSFLNLHIKKEVFNDEV